MSKLKASTSTHEVMEGKIDIGISQDSLKKIANMLNENLADEYVLLTKTKKYHWNIIDPRFNDLHKFLDEQYQLLATSVDEIAESKTGWGHGQGNP
jgi:starvation-inducible DNA-binding protein